MLATSQRALKLPGTSARHYDPRRGLAPMQQYGPTVRSGRMNLRLGSFRRPTQRAAASTQIQSSIPEGVWENQRFYYAFGWNAPIPSLDGPGYWTNCVDGAAVPEEVNPFATSGAGEIQVGDQAVQWVVEVTPATDSQGWMYGSHFQTLNSRREGGRACRRPADFVRRRKWLQQHVASTAATDQHAFTSGTGGTAPPDSGRQRATSFVSRSDAMHVTPASAAKADDTRRTNFRMSAGTAAKAFFSMLQDAAKRRRGGLMSIPWDPLAWGSVYSMHSAWLANTQSLLLAHRLHSKPQDLEHAMHAMRDAIASTSSHSSMHDALTQELADDMHGAVDFARAAYGYAFLSGGLSSIARYLHMQTLQRSTFDVIAGVSAEENTLAFCAIADVAIGDVVLAEWHNTTYRPCHVLAIDHARQRIVLTIRGSLELGDLLTDLHAKPIAVQLPILDGEHAQCHVHEGMLRAAAYVHCNTADALVEASGRFPDWPLFVTGHSLGGGVAALVAVLLRQQGGAPERLQENGITCMTIGTGSSMSLELAAACKDYVTSLVLANDVVPRLSYHTVEHLLDELIRKSPALNFAESVRTSVALTFAPFTTAGRAAAADAAAAAAGGEAAGGYTAGGAAAVAARSAADGGTLGAPLRGAPSDAIQLAEMPSGTGFGSLDLTPTAPRPQKHPRASTGFSGTISTHRPSYASPPKADPAASTTLRNTTDFNSAVSSGARLEASFRSLAAPTATATTGVERAALVAGAAGAAGVFPSEEITTYPSASDELRDPLPSASLETANSGETAGVIDNNNNDAATTSHLDGSKRSDRNSPSTEEPSFADEMDRLWGQVQMHEARSAVMFSDGMATGTPPQSPPQGTDTSVWRKLLAPMEGILGTASQDNPPTTPPNPFTPEAIRLLAEKSRQEKEQAEQERQAHAQAQAEEPPPGAPLVDVSVANPLRYLEESGISRSRGSSISGEATADNNANTNALGPGAFSSDRHRAAAVSDPLGDGAAQYGFSAGAANTNASQVQAIDDSVLHQADAGHVAAAASSAAPPPLYPPGRVLWLIPLKTATKANDSPGKQEPPAQDSKEEPAAAPAPAAVDAAPAAAGADTASTAADAAAAAAAAPPPPPRSASATRMGADSSDTNSSEIVSTTLLPSHPQRLATKDVFHAAYSSQRKTPSPPRAKCTPAPGPEEANTYKPPSEPGAPFSTPLATPYPSNPLESSNEDLPNPTTNSNLNSNHPSFKNPSQSHSSFHTAHPSPTPNPPKPLENMDSTAADKLLSPGQPQSPPLASNVETNAQVNPVSTSEFPEAPGPKSPPRAPKRNSSFRNQLTLDNEHVDASSHHHLSQNLRDIELEDRRKLSSDAREASTPELNDSTGVEDGSNTPEDKKSDELLQSQNDGMLKAPSGQLMEASVASRAMNDDNEGIERTEADARQGGDMKSPSNAQNIPEDSKSQAGTEATAGAAAAQNASPIRPAVKDSDQTAGRSKFIQLASETLMSVSVDDVVRSSQYEGEELDFAVDEFGSPLHSSGPSQQLPLSGVISDKGADIAAGAFAAGLVEGDAPVDGAWGQSQDGESAQVSKGGWDAAPKWLKRLVQRQPSSQRDDELLPHLQAASQDAAGGGEEGEEADMSLGSHPVALSSGTLTAENSPTGRHDGERPDSAQDGEGAQANGERSTEFVIESVSAKREHSSKSTPPEGSGEEPPKDQRSSELATEVAVIDMTDRRDVFNYLTLCADMVQDHLPDQYTKAIALVVSQTKEKTDMQG